MQKAEELFALKGFDGTTVRDIARAAGVNLAMISYYFGSKEKLIENLFGMRMEDIKLKIGNVVNNDSISCIQKMEVLISQYIDRVYEHRNFYRVMFVEQFLQKNEAILSFLKKYKVEVMQLVTNVIKNGQEQQLFKKNVDMVLLLTTMTGTVMQMCINEAFYKEQYNLGEMEQPDFEIFIKEKLNNQIRIIFKAILEYEV